MLTLFGVSALTFMMLASSKSAWLICNRPALFNRLPEPSVVRTDLTRPRVVALRRVGYRKLPTALVAPPTLDEPDTRTATTASQWFGVLTVGTTAGLGRLQQVGNMLGTACPSTAGRMTATKLRPTMRWIAKALLQKGLSALPGPERANYVFQHYVSCSLPVGEDI